MKKLLVLFLALLLTTACSPAHSTNPGENRDVYNLLGVLSESFDSSRFPFVIHLPDFPKPGILQIKFVNASADNISESLWIVVQHPNGTVEKFDAVPLYTQGVDLEIEVTTIPGEYAFYLEGTGTNTFVEYYLEWKASDTD